MENNNIEINNKELSNIEKREIKNEVKEILKQKENSSKKEEVFEIKKELTKEQKISKFFNKLEFLSLEDDQKEEVVLKIKDESTGDLLYWIEIFLSSSIATLGLLQNSVAVVIGAMLIAPLLRPINGLSFSIARGEHKFFSKTLTVLFFSVLLSILMGFLIVFIIGLPIESSEVLSRTSPNIIDFFIAIFSAIVAVMSLRFSRLGESIAGVAMAASLMPPLTVVGMEIALYNYNLAWGAWMLFLTNLVAIILIGIVFFWLYGFTPHVGVLQKSSIKRSSFIIILIIFITLPLISSLNTIKESAQISMQVSNYLNEIIEKKVDDFMIYDIETISINKDLIKLKSKIKIPENKNIIPILDNINGKLSEKTGIKVELELEIQRVINLVSEEK